MKISVFGMNNLEKSIFIKRIIEILKLKNVNYKKPKSFQNNYFEDVFFQNDQKFVLTNLPYFPLLEKKNEDFFSSEMRALNERKIVESDHALFIFNFEDFYSDGFLQTAKIIEKKSKKVSFVYFDSSGKDFPIDHFSFKSESFYNIPFFPSLDSKENIKVFIKKELGIYPEKKVESEQAPPLLKAIIIGPPNSGKSSLLNSIIGYDRSLVSSIEGTTREDINSFFSYKEWNFGIIDTEGISKKQDAYSLDSIKSSDLIFLVIDVTRNVTKNVLQIIDVSQKYNRPSVIVLNKIDLVDRFQLKEKETELRSRLKSFSFVPIVFISATRKINFNSLFENLENIITESKIYLSKRIVTNHSKELIERNQPPLIEGKRLKIYYGFHENGLLHKIILFVNEPKCVHFSYERYILNSFRNKSGIKNLPIKLFFKKS